MTAITPRKRFSQNFLTDQGIARKIVASLDIGPADCILEIGPGSGALTRPLLAMPLQQLVCMDLDERAIQHLNTEPLAKDPRVTLRQADVLQANCAALFPTADRSNRAIIGNIPYAITSQLLFWAFEQRNDVSRVVMMMQREVALRCVAGPGTKDYGILSLASWLYSEPKLLFNVRPGSFYPRPSVTSSVVRFDLRQRQEQDVDHEKFMRFVRAAFSQRRKVLSNALVSWSQLSGIGMKSEMVVHGVKLGQTRAEQLSPVELMGLFVELTA